MHSTQKIPFTKPEYEKMQASLAKLQAGRGEIVGRLQAAREMGDLSENGAYKYAKFELRTTDSKIRYLEHLLNCAEIKESQNLGVVDFGSRVTLDNGKQVKTYLMVGKLESDPQKNKLSLQSPLGRALIGKKPGDRIEVNAPAGVVSYTVAKVE